MSSYDPQEPDDRPDPEDPDESDMDEHDEPDLIPCPHCRKMINEDAERCHHCGDWVEIGGRVERSPWMTIVLVLIILSMLGFAIVWLVSAVLR
jgi:hypothetical protein